MTPRILIVEDEAIIARDIQLQLRELGYAPVDIAVDGHEAVTFARRLRPQLVLLDIHLPGTMDGIDAAVIIRHELGIPCIFLTAYATRDIVERAKQADPSGYIIKPFDAQILRTTIEIALNRESVNERLRRSQATLADAQLMAHVGSGEVDFRTGEALWSLEACRILEHDPAVPLSAERFTQRFSPEDVALAAIVYDSGRHTQDGADFDARIVMDDGRIKHVRLHVRRLMDDAGVPVKAFCTLQDVTSQRAVDELVRLQAAALNASADAVVITDIDGTIDWVNPAFTEITGYTLSEAVGRNPRDLVKSGKHTAAFYRELWTTIVEGRVWSGEVTNRRKDGSLYVEQQVITPVRNAAGAITHFVGVKRELTEHKRLQEQFLQAQKMEVIGRLAGGVAHDFNNLLTIINGTSELAIEELAPDHPMRAEFEEIRNAGERAAQLTRQLLAFSRKQLRTPAIVSVGAQAAQGASMLRRLIGEDVKLTLKAPAGIDDHVLVDPGQLEQVLLNLAVNARDAMPDGGTLTVETAAVDIAPAQHTDLPAGRYVSLSVHDTGSGMTPDVRSRVFEPFFTTKGPGIGTGLGLATVYGIVHQSGGSIEVESEPGQGSCFTVLLPWAAGPEVAAVATPAAAAPGTETVLLVEDEESLRTMTARMLRTGGYRVVTARSGEEALDRIREHEGHISLLLSDVILGGMTGYDLAARLAPGRPDLRVLFASGYADEKVRRPEWKDSSFIAKPFTANTLRLKVREALDSRRP